MNKDKNAMVLYLLGHSKNKIALTAIIKTKGRILMKKLACLQILAATLCWTGTASATLIDRGNGMIYDSNQNLTWLQDANYAKTSGYNSDGLMSWDEAMTWVSNLTYGGYDDWRLPNLEIRTTYFDFGFINFITTEIWSAMPPIMCLPFLGTPIGICQLPPPPPFTNITSELFWYGIDDGDLAWASDVGGFLHPFALYPKSESFQAWAVRDGDVPEPHGLALVILGLACMHLVTRKPVAPKQAR
ncbi:MAG: DUF1566 domain-containing protein [Thiobacillus sp.]|nr:DUF1566 domain-containing protein [Thiobacillus sp.]MBN8766839.1 DUF1566 domain-containing protein [Thiobacillus sp.]MBN8772902.1 DUF1566 domain-containing protein [Thiobacillus sp.]